MNGTYESSDDTVAKVALFLDSVRAGLKGFCWNINSRDLPCFNGEITIRGHAGEIVLICRQHDGQLLIAEFARQTPNQTELGRQVRQLLAERGLEIKSD